MEFSIGQVISGTFGMVRERFGSLLVIYLLYFGISIAAMVVFAVVAGGAMVGMIGMTNLEDPSMMGAGMGIGMILVMIVFYVAYILLALAQVASLTTMASPLHQPSIGQAMGVGWRSAPTLLGLVFVLIVAYLLLAVVIGVLGAALMTMGEAGTVVFGLIVVVGLVYISCRLSVMFPVVSVEGQRNPLTAIARSWRLTSGRVLPIFIVTLVFMVIMVVAFGIALAPMIGSFSAMMMGMEPEVEPAIGAVFGSIGLLVVVGILFAIVYAAFMAVLHAALSGSTGEDFRGTFE